MCTLAEYAQEMDEKFVPSNEDCLIFLDKKYRHFRIII